MNLNRHLIHLSHAALGLIMYIGSSTGMAQTSKTNKTPSSVMPPLSSSVVTKPTVSTSDKPLNNAQINKVDDILSRQFVCSSTLILRSQALKPEQEQAICQQLGQLETQFHELFAGKGKQLTPVLHDDNRSLRANIYQDQANYAQHAGKHFDMPTNNGGMYLEGLPEQKGNQAEFVAYQRAQGQVHNLGHEYIHYLDGRFNLYGDFCANLHDSHAPPENCPRPAPDGPYLVWWSEGIAEYMAHKQNNATAKKVAAGKAFRLSELFETAYEKNTGSERIYTWGYLATRFMMEQHRDKVEAMLTFTRKGDYPRYQALIRSWGTSLDAEFATWLDKMSVEGTSDKAK